MWKNICEQCQPEEAHYDATAQAEGFILDMGVCLEHMHKTDFRPNNLRYVIFLMSLWSQRPSPLKCFSAPCHKILAKSAPQKARVRDIAEFATTVRKSS